MSTEIREWLLGLCQSSEAYERLIGEAGSLALAAYKLAHAKRICAGYANPTPNKLDLKCAAREIASRCAWFDTIPKPHRLVAECRLAGLPVLD